MAAHAPTYPGAMAAFDSKLSQIVIRIVYDGAGTAGKTTNLNALTSLFTPARRGELFTPQSAHGRTLFFDYIQLEGGLIAGHRFRCELWSVPGQHVLRPRREYLLNRGDVAVIVVDSRPEGIEAAKLMVDSYYRAQERMGPWLVVQANKQDCPGALPPDAVREALDLPSSTPVVGAEADKGMGVRETTVLAMRCAAILLQPTVIKDGPEVLGEDLPPPEEIFGRMKALHLTTLTGPEVLPVEGEPGAASPVDSLPPPAVDSLAPPATQAAGAPQRPTLQTPPSAQPAQLTTAHAAQPQSPRAPNLQSGPPSVAQASPPRPAGAPFPMASTPPAPQQAGSAGRIGIGWRKAPLPTAPTLTAHSPVSPSANAPATTPAAPPPPGMLTPVPPSPTGDRSEQQLPALPPPPPVGVLIAKDEHSARRSGAIAPPPPAHASASKRAVQPAVEPGPRLKPTLPVLGSARLQVWPTMTGRSTLEQVPLSRAKPVPLQAGEPATGREGQGIVAYSAGDWLLRTTANNRFLEHRDAYAVLVKMARHKTLLGDHLVKDTVLALQPSEDGFWLWSVAPRRTSLGQQIAVALEQQDEPALATALEEYANAAILAARMAFTQGMALKLHPNHFAASDGRIYYLSDDISAEPGHGQLAKAWLQPALDHADYPEAVNRYITELERLLPIQLTAEQVVSAELIEQLAPLSLPEPAAQQAQVRLLQALSHCQTWRAAGSAKS